MRGLAGMREFDVEMKVVNGKTIPIIKCKAETVVKEDGTKHTIIHAPTLGLVNKALKRE